MAIRASVERQIRSRRKKTTFYLLGLTSGLFFALSVFCDVVIYHVLLPDPVAFALAEQWVSFGFTVVALLVLSIPVDRTRRLSVGSKLDPAFSSVSLPPRRILGDILLFGVFAGVSSFSYYFLTGSSGDVSALLPFSRFSLIYLMVGDLILIRDYPTVVEVQSLLSITFGVVLVGSSFGSFDILMLLFVVVVWGGSVAVGVFFQSRAKRREIRPGVTIDSLNLRLWQLLALNVMMTVFLLPSVTPEVVSMLALQFVSVWPWLLLPVSFTFVSLITYLQALGMGKMSVVQGVSSVSVILGIPLNLVGALLLPGVFPSPVGDSFTWLIKLIGTVFVFSGIVALSLSEMKAYVFVLVTRPSRGLMTALRRIHGVTRVSAVTGHWDYLVRIDIRSLGSARAKTLQRIEEMPGVRDMETVLILQEWED